MIVKYENGGTWGYVDNIECVVNQEIHAHEMMLEKRNLIESGEEEEHTPRDICQCSDEEYVKTLAFNDLFMAVSDMLAEAFEEYNYTMMPLIDQDEKDSSYPHTVVICNLKDNKEFDKLMIITNQKVYLLNDNGKTIERLN